MMICQEPLFHDRILSVSHEAEQMAIKTKDGQVRKKYQKVTPKERNIMLFWYTALDGNYSAVARRTYQQTGIKRSRKVILETAKKHNFATLSHIVRDDVNKRLYGADTPGLGRILKLTADLMDIDEDLINHCKRYLMGDSKSKIENMTELLKVVSHVGKDITNVTGVKDIKRDAMAHISENMKEEINVSVEQVLSGLEPDEKEDVLKRIVEQQINKIMENKGEISDDQKKRTDRLVKDMVKNMDDILV